MERWGGKNVLSLVAKQGMQLKTICKESTACVLIKTLFQSMFSGRFAANQKASFKGEEGFLQRLLKFVCVFWKPCLGLLASARQRCGGHTEVVYKLWHIL